MRKRIAILGSTGSIGVNTLKVVAELKGRFEVTALSADSNIEFLSKQSHKYCPKIIAVRDSFLAARIRRMVPDKTKVVFGVEGLNEIVCRQDIDQVVFAVAGSVCIIPLCKAIESGKGIALANKESLVSAGAVIMKTARERGVRIIPIDSEHSAIFQCLEGRGPYLKKIYLTGSGGPLLNIPKKRFDKLSQDFILKHPKWKMGKKISVDSATMMNKGLEVIEARWLFDIDERLIDILIHPEAIIHSMIEMVDGDVFAQMSLPDMRSPIQYALTYPERLKNIIPTLDFLDVKRLTFRKPDIKKFPCLGLARAALKNGGTYCAVLNAADEEAVKNYLGGRIKFSAIPDVIEGVLARHKDVSKKCPSASDIRNAECWAREEARSICYR